MDRAFRCFTFSLLTLATLGILWARVEGIIQ
jgi:hypothetical protein